MPRLQRMIRAASTYHEGKRERGRAGRIQNRTLIKLAGSQSQVVNSQPLKQDIFDLLKYLSLPRFPTHGKRVPVEMLYF